MAITKLSEAAMVTDKPKAAHFDAWCNGGKLPPHDPIGLQYRWAAAGAIEREVCRDMFHADAKAIRARLQQANAGRAVIVTLRDECPVCCGTGECDSGGTWESGDWIMVPCECLSASV